MAELSTLFSHFLFGAGWSSYIVFGWIIMDMQKNGLIAFDFYFPMYNWFFPFSYNPLNRELLSKIKDNKLDIYKYIGNSPRNRALYFHIPYCQDICSFCPFTREICSDDNVLDKYVKALEREIYLKTQYENIAGHPVDSIFIGGGTPSILKPKHILRLGKAIRNNFNTVGLKEFSFEMNAKTVTPDRVAALKEIGVTHARMGVQTFNPKYRELFRLTATLNQIYNGARLLNDSFDYVCVDLLYGMHGQSPDDFLKDLHHIISLGTPTIDVYPINNTVTQAQLNKSYRDSNLMPTSGLSKLSMNIVLNEFMRAGGYFPHNGHGYVKLKNSMSNNSEVVTNSHRFQYHEAIYGYKGHEVIGFGSVAFSSFDGYVAGNSGNTKEYVEKLLNDNDLLFGAGEYDINLCESKGISLHLPYHGEAEKAKMNMDAVKPEILERLGKAIGRGLVTEDETSYKLTRLGWYWYVNLLYYLSPESDQIKLRRYIDEKSSDHKHFIEDWEITLDF